MSEDRSIEEDAVESLCDSMQARPDLINSVHASRIWNRSKYVPRDLSIHNVPRIHRGTAGRAAVGTRTTLRGSPGRSHAEQELDKASKQDHRRHELVSSGLARTASHDGQDGSSGTRGLKQAQTIAESSRGGQQRAIKQQMVMAKPGTETHRMTG